MTFMPNVKQAGLVVLAGLLALSTARVARAQETGPSPGSPPADVAEVMAAQDLLYVAYPELMVRQLVVDLKKIAGQMVVSVRDAAPVDGAPAALLDATIEFDTAHRLRAFRAYGALVEGRRNQALFETLFRNPEWADSDAEVWVLERGGRGITERSFEPAAEIDAARWQTYLGSNVRAGTSTFNWRQQEAPTRFAAKPAWQADVEATATDGAPVRYRFEFEPFSGRLVAVTRQ